MTSYSPTDALKKYFGYSEFRPLQEEVIRCIQDKKDALVVMPSGGGKSVCFQIPAIISEGITIVVSPLIALMKDQVEGLIANGIEAAFINSSVALTEQQSIMDKALKNGLKLLYVAPERLVSSEFIQFLKKLKICLFAIDEAHCISVWGHDFRPEYARLSILKKEFPEIPVAALTATADKITRGDIQKQLQLSKPELFLASFDRPNLSLTVLPAKNRFRIISEYIRDHQGQSGIIYCLSRKTTENMAARLSAVGINAAFYHAGMNAKDRNAAQEAFIHDDIPVVCATIAFGMGIDKPNVRWIIHYNLPKNMEGYYQEIGRAGRDGIPSDTFLFYSFADVVLLKSFAEDSGQPGIQLAKLERMQQYAEAATCRRKILLSYFNENLENDCGNCDVCHNPPETFDGTIMAQKALSAISRLGEKVPAGLLIDILRGSGKREIMEEGYHNIKTYGAGKDLSYFDWQQYLLQMLHQGLIEIAYDDNRNLKLTKASRKILFEKQAVRLVRFSDHLTYRDQQEAFTKRMTKKERMQKDMFEVLRLLRKQIADKQGVPAYIVFSDKTLHEMAEKRPSTLQEMKYISGIGDHKLDVYGEQFISEIVKFKIEEKDRGSTHLKTFELFKSGMLVEEIAQERKLNSITIISHLAAMYEKGAELDIHEFINPDELTKINHAIRKLGNKQSLKVYFDHLKGQVEYARIRMGIADYNRNEA